MMELDKTGLEAALLSKSMKPEEIAGPMQSERVDELIAWMVRYGEGNANPKWLATHAADLAYYALKCRQIEATHTSDALRDLQRLGQECEGLDVRAALQRLVELKDGPRDAVYSCTKGAAWQAARDALAREPVGEVEGNVDDA